MAADWGTESLASLSPEYISIYNAFWLAGFPSDAQLVEGGVGGRENAVRLCDCVGCQSVNHHLV